MLKLKVPNLGIGIGFRLEHFEEIHITKPNIDWFEIISENFMTNEGFPVECLEIILENYPVVQHGVSLSIGSPAPLDFEYLKNLKKLARKTKTPWISDHLCWGHLPGAHFHDLLPLPYTKGVIEYVSKKAAIVQDFLEIPFALENLSSYLSFNQNEITEWQFYSEIVEKGNIYMMLDINNIYVSSKNHGFDPREYYENIPMERVLQIHLAGHQNNGEYLLDTHDQPVCDEVWKLYENIFPLTNGVSTLLEWDENFLSFHETWQEALKAKKYQASLLNKHNNK